MVAENTIVCPKRFDCAKWIAFPDLVDSGHVPEQDWRRVGEIDRHSVKVFGIGIEGPFKGFSSPHILKVLLHPFLEVTLCRANVRFASCVAFNSVDQDAFSAYATVVTPYFITVFAVAREGIKVFGDYLGIEFVCRVAIEDFSKIGESVI